jgi:hypothetical protein
MEHAGQKTPIKEGFHTPVASDERAIALVKKRQNFRF